jgi:cellulose synthase (UDP-forming)
VRYFYWRLTATVAFEDAFDFFFGWGLVLAELYSLTVLLLGYLQTTWTLNRQPVALPADLAVWPSVDILIPTYNEPLSVVRQAVLAALTIDWPADRLRVYVLDDGRREEFRQYFEQSDAHYLTRDNNDHAKAGNLNAALLATHGEYVAIFDCDHIPTRSFLQLCMGWFLKDPKLAMLQTPHHFFSPDPFEKNLNTFQTVPNEGALFYGLVQDGNDLWNATFFCGSCAVIRRAPLLEVGGIAIDTVTEDAHTALNLSRKGYNTAYLAIPQAAGLATESLSGHIGQRIRWARGMGQIFRVDNPLLGPGLSLGQRLCYLNAMLHFFYGLPRLVFLTAPLAYLLLNAHIFEATAPMILVYVLPHILLANITNSTIQGRFRHSFWNEVYETVLAWYILRPVLMAVINPKFGSFNVTAKGGTISRSYWDWVMARPYLILLILNLVGLAVGLYRLGLDEGDVGTLLINLTWTLYNLMVISASAAVANETAQHRVVARVHAELPAHLSLNNGRTIVCQTSDFSANGLGLVLTQDATLQIGEPVNVSIFRGSLECAFPGTIVVARGKTLGVQFAELTRAQQMMLVQVTFGRADMWSAAWGASKPDAPYDAVKVVMGIGIRNLLRLTRVLIDLSIAPLRAVKPVMQAFAKK